MTKRKGDVPAYAQTEQICEAVRHRIYNQRAAQNHRILANNNGVGMKKVAKSRSAQTAPMASEAVARIREEASLFRYALGGARLGELMGGELLPLADQMKSQSSTLAFNAALLQSLAPMVPEDKRVRECVTEAKLKAVFHRLQKKMKAA